MLCLVVQQRSQNERLSVYFDVAKDHRIQSLTERRAQTLVKPRKCLTSSSSQVLECDERSWPCDPKHLFSRVRHAIDHLIVRIFASFGPVHMIFFDRLLCDFSFLLTVYLNQICPRFSVGTYFPFSTYDTNVHNDVQFLLIKVNIFTFQTVFSALYFSG